MLSPAVAPVEAQGDYLESSEHYEAVARRAVVVLRNAGGPFVLLISDVPVNARALAGSLSKVAGPDRTAIAISCGPALTVEDLDLHGVAAGRSAKNSRAEENLGVCSPSAHCPRVVRPPADIVYIFCKRDSFRDKLQPTILLCSSGFSRQLDHPALYPLTQRISARFDFQEVSAEETRAVLHNRLLAHRDRHAETRGFRRGMLIGLASSAVAMAAAVGVFLLTATVEQLWHERASTTQQPPEHEKTPTSRPVEPASSTAATDQAAVNSEIEAVLATELPSTSRASAPKTPSPASAPPPEPNISAEEIATLLARGDWFFSAGDITSARLFYERAVDAGNVWAAFRLGTIYDPSFRTQMGLSGSSADPSQALFWYQRARAVGVGKAEQPIKALAGSALERDSGSR